jgi:hypothetical protein
MADANPDAVTSIRATSWEQQAFQRALYYFIASECGGSGMARARNRPSSE